MNSKKRTGVIGCGWFGRAHCRVYNEIADLVAVCDVDGAKAKETAETYGINWYVDIESMLKENLDAVSIVVPPEKLTRAARSFAEKGISILIEKPLAVNIDEAQDLIKFEDHVRINPGFIELFNPAFDMLKENTKRVGEPIMVSTRRIGRSPRRFWQIGVVMDLAFHDLYLLSNMLGPYVVKDSVLGYHHNAKFEDAAASLIEFNNGVKGVVEANWLTPIKERRMRIYGSTGVIEIDFITQEISIQTQDGENSIEKRIQPYKQEEPLKRELVNFLYEERAPMNFREGIDILKSALKICKRL